MANEQYDVIIIGSGMGGLASASILAQQQGKRVLMLERHFKVGGFTHTFVRKGKYEWDVGIHYVGDMQKGRQSRAVFDYITQGGVKWQKMPDQYDRFMFPDFSFGAPTGKNQYIRALIERFPAEQTAIEQYFADMKTIMGWFKRYMASRMMPKGLGWVGNALSKSGNSLALMTTQAYLDTHFKDPRLKAVLPAQWGDHGLPPEQSTFMIHSMIATHYLYGAWYPIGSSKTIAESIVPIIESTGGQVLVNHTVDEILIENGKAIGVRVNHKKGKQIIQKEFFAKHIISNAGASITYTKLIPEDYPLDCRDEVADFPDSAASVTAYLGLKDDPRSLGFEGENYWMYGSLDHNQNFAQRNALIDGKVNTVYLSFPSLKNPEAKGHTAEAITFCDAEPFRQWADQTWKQRDADYEQLKQRIMDAMLDFVEARHPGFRNLVDYCELSTPLSTEHFTGFKNGAIYGIPATRKRYEVDWMGPRTPIKNLYLTGSDVISHGIVGAMMGGLLTASLVLGLRNNFMKLITDATKYSQTLDD